jgi:putative selenate reductase
MSKVMRATPLPRLLARVAGEYRAKRSIFEIPEAAFRRAFELEAGSPGLEVMGSSVSLPVGPAAGPHSQIAPNLVAAYLAGARVFELKTVQENDELEIEKPCIDALDEGHNTEWSTELSLVAAREEYLRGWMAIQLLASLFSSSPRSFVFNMSVGYSLEGIKGAKVDAFIEGLRAPAATSFWKAALRDLEAFVESGELASSFGPESVSKARALLADFPASPVASATLSTMHGCPPAEIERIGAYLIRDKGLDTYVKLNPTLLGYDRARSILDATLWREIELRRDKFERDLQFPEALRLVASLSSLAKAEGRRFGIKLSNTLPNDNHGAFLPGAERYLSGRALFPLTTRLAADLAAALPGWDSRFSYCGGARGENVGELVAAGLGPVTMATDILKPGGYLRLLPAARAAVTALPGSPDRPDAEALERLAEGALARPEYRGPWKGGDARIAKGLPLFDCFAAPCIEACPVRQKAPEYIGLQAEGRSEEGFDSILGDNPLPFITGTLCDHVCQEACSRNDYEGSVEIRAVKLVCARSAGAGRRPMTPARSRGQSFPGKVAAIGAGPAGLSCAYHLALAGVPVTVFDEAPSPGGVPANVIPRFRIPREDLAADIDRIRSLGAEFRPLSRVESLEALRAQGYSAFFACTGAPLARELQIEGSSFPIVDALAFLAAASRTSAGGAGAAASAWPYGQSRHVVVAGGGNTAMDAARVALRLPGIETVRLSYRRTREEMPADEEELRNAIEEGCRLMELSLPERGYDGHEGPRLSLRIMELGERDPSGRRSPRPTERTESVDCDLLVLAIGERPDASLLASLGLACGPNGLPSFDPETQESSRKGLYVGGDAARGPSSIISAVADGRRAAYAMLKAAGIEPSASPYVPPPPDRSKLALRGEFAESLPPASPGFAAREAERCLRCDSACLRCVEVCPNRANFALPVAVDSTLSQSLQIIHIDELCNECGNCGVFCPYEGEPYRGKPTLFADREAMELSDNAGVCFGDGTNAKAGPALLLREERGGEVRKLEFARWSAEGECGPMGTLARTIWREQRYLVGGGR